MDDTKRTVVGVFDERMDAVMEIQRLQNLGYSRDEINVYTSPERSKTVERLLGIGVTDVDTKHQEEDISWWETIKNSFNFFAFDGDQGDKRIRSIDDPRRTGLTLEAEASIRGGKNEGMVEFLAPYRSEIDNNKLVIVVHNYGRHNEMP